MQFSPRRLRPRIDAAGGVCFAGVALVLAAMLIATASLGAQSRPASAPASAPASSSAPASAPVWRTAGIVSTVALDLAKSQPDAGMKASVNDGVMEVRVDGVPYSYVELTQRVDYHQADAVRIAVAEVKSGSVSLQAVCYDASGKATNYVDLLEYIEEPGTFEVPLRIYRTPLKGARQLSFRIWFAGGKDSVARVTGVEYGQAE